MKSVLTILLFMLVLVGGVAATPRADLLQAVGTAKDFVDALVDGIRPALEQVAERVGYMSGQAKEPVARQMPKVLYPEPSGRTRLPSATEHTADRANHRVRIERSAPAMSRTRRISGSAYVVDGDTLRIGSTRIRLHGIDAPETDQTCRDRGRSWPCGRRATQALARRIGRSPVACDERDRDDYGRVVAVCRAGGMSLNRWMVAQGWALAYRRYSWNYVGEERAAKRARRGIWRGDFVKPWRWRHG